MVALRSPNGRGIVMNHERWRFGCGARRLLAVRVLAGCAVEVWRTENTDDLALIFLLLRLRRRTRFFLHLALILNELEAATRLALYFYRCAAGIE